MNSFKRGSIVVAILVIALAAFTSVVLAYTGTLTATPSVTTVKAGAQFEVLVKANLPAATDCMATAGYYFKPASGSTLTAANITASINFHNSTKYVQLSSALQSIGGTSPIYGDTARVVSLSAPTVGPVTDELLKVLMTINVAGNYAFVATNGLGVGQDTLITCNGQEFGQSATGFSVTVVDSIVSGKVTQNDGTTGIANVVVNLIKGATVVATQTTSANGNYSLTTNGPGTYLVQALPTTVPGTPSWVAVTPNEVGVTVPGDATVNFKFIGTTQAGATVLTTIPQYSLQGHTAGWSLDYGTLRMDGSTTLGTGGAFGATVSNFTGDFWINLNGYNIFWGGAFVPNAAGVNYGPGTICVETQDVVAIGLGYGQTGAEDLTEIAAQQGSSNYAAFWADPSGDGKVTAVDYSLGLGSAGCSSNKIPPAPVVRAAHVATGVAEFGLSLTRVGPKYNFRLTAESADSISGLMMVVDQSQWGVSAYTPVDLPGFALQGNWEENGKRLFYYERELAADGTLPQLPLPKVVVGEGQLSSCTVGQIVPSEEYPYSHMGRPRVRLASEWTGDWGTCPQGSVSTIYLPIAAR